MSLRAPAAKQSPRSRVQLFPAICRCTRRLLRAEMTSSFKRGIARPRNDMAIREESLRCCAGSFIFGEEYAEQPLLNPPPYFKPNWNWIVDPSLRLMR